MTACASIHREGAASSSPTTARNQSPTQHSALSTRHSLAAGAGEALDPALHEGLGLGDVVVAEPLLGVDAVHGVDGAVEVLLVAVGHGGVDAHAALEAGVGGGPFLVARRHALGRLEGLADAAGDGVEDVEVGVH